jgi:hypothetical protein
VFWVLHSEQPVTAERMVTSSRRSQLFTCQRSARGQPRAAVLSEPRRGSSSTVAGCEWVVDISDRLLTVKAVETAVENHPSSLLAVADSGVIKAGSTPKSIARPEFSALHPRCGAT